MTAEVDREFKEKHTFAPRREKKEEKKGEREKSEEKKKEGGRKVVITKERLDELAKSKKDKIKKLEQEKAALELRELEKMPFKVFINYNYYCYCHYLISPTVCYLY